MQGTDPLSAAGILGGVEESIRALPASTHILVGAALGAGLVLWCMGRRVLRPIFAILGGLAGAIVGMISASTFTGSNIIGSVPTPYIGYAIGSVIGLLLSIVLFRFAVALTTALVLGLLGLLGAGTYLHWNPGPEAAGSPTRQVGAPAPDEPAPLLAVLQGQANVPAPEVTPDAPVAERARVFARDLEARLSELWHKQPGRHQWVMSLSALGGAVLGLALGVMMPSRSAAAVTAMFGSAVWLPSAVWLAMEFEAPGRRALDLGMPGWLIVWVVVATVGFIAQISGLAKKRPPPAEE